MNFKKTIAKSLVVAMALGMVPVANLQTAKAAATFTFKGTEGTATVNGAKFWGIAKEDKKGGKDSVEIGGKKYKITNVQDIAGMIDVYAALKGKAGIIAAGDTPTPDSNWNVLSLDAADNTFKVQFVASTSAVKGTKPANALGGEFGYLFATKGKKGAEEEVNLKTDAEKVEVKLNDGNWQTFKAFIGGEPSADTVNTKLRALGQSGSSLSFRIMGTNTAWASKESKLKIATQGNAPAAKVDVTKETTSIKNGVEWQVVEAGAAADATKWKLSTSKKGLTLDELKLDATKDQDLLVRTGATAKKIASKVGRVTLKKPESALTVGTSNEITGTGAAINVGGKTGVIVSSTLAYDITKGLLLQNVSNKDIEYALVPSTGDTSKFKWSVLKASKDPVKKPTKANLKYSKDEKANTWTEGKTKLFLRLSGVKQDKNGVATRSGVSAGAIIKIANIAQNVTFESGSSSDTVKSTINASATTAAIQIATGTAATFTINAKVDKVVNPKGGSPKVKVVKALPKGVTYKVGKVDGATGKFTITVNVSNKAFTGAEISADAEYGLTYEGANSGFKITFAKKN
ncbi:hypothetical protein [Catonella massiliensis]|uniref:Uncharacterized protein n=1 Tax=Catonella massiliensis TaxID=2799636 RepID=A0ABS1IX27_9FIRM|nr:hypothetical protein [Catonella massiliensis]MBK5896452.1 hypothetical protein [Catonella massiliensis]